MLAKCRDAWQKIELKTVLEFLDSNIALYILQLTGLIDEFIAEYNKIFLKVCRDLGDLDGRDVECPTGGKPTITTERVVKGRSTDVWM